MIKGLINVMGVRPGDTILDPMMGSGTVLIEATLMGVHSLGIDASPFCQFMTQAKLDGLTVPLQPIRQALQQAPSLFQYFGSLTKGEERRQAHKPSDVRAPSLFDATPGGDGLDLPKELELPEVQNFLLLAYLDSVGYSERSQRKSPYEQFCAILERYLFVVEKIQLVLEGAESELGKARSMEGDARELPVTSSTVDGVIFSPPYSFAIDYLENDASHLRFLGTDADELKDQMVGLRGKTKREKYDHYVADMGQVLAECARVLRPGRICTVVIGTNTNQLSKILRTDPESVVGLDQVMADLGSPHGLKVVNRIERQITGMANTMRSEFIVMMQKQ